MPTDLYLKLPTDVHTIQTCLKNNCVDMKWDGKF